MLYLGVTQGGETHMPMINRTAPPIVPQISPEEMQIVPTLVVTGTTGHIQHDVDSTADVSIKESIEYTELLAQFLHLKLIEQENAEEQNRETSHQ